MNFTKISGLSNQEFKRRHFLYKLLKKMI